MEITSAVVVDSGIRHLKILNANSERFHGQQSGPEMSSALRSHVGATRSYQEPFKDESESG
jgi:hypothetical protein